MAELGWSKEGDTVVLRMQESDYENLMIASAYALGTVEYLGITNLEHQLLTVVRNVNKGNPQFFVSAFWQLARNIVKVGKKD